ncbi:hypothetical protein BBEV_2559 [Salisediminibacterium beveridgei]|uniref:Uncharacterized protein n=3 Tax=Bacillaceae TaxID=186817 RepID=A0A1D7QY50_9BACI|nr:hypothetical protein Bsel_2975 [[Bacillus] selenitireducens MLS10]AOM83898.1 hypothetical protein BBEV_2559 [Salisediminibacterium beveridgei]
MLSGGSFGTSLGKSWLFNQEGGAANADQYMMVIENYIRSFLVSGGILFGTGLLTVTLTYFVYLFHGIRNTND